MVDNDSILPKLCIWQGIRNFSNWLTHPSRIFFLFKNEEKESLATQKSLYNLECDNPMN